MARPNIVAASSEYASARSDLLSRLHGFLKETKDPILEGIPTSPMHDFALAAFEGAEGFPYDRASDHRWLR